MTESQEAFAKLNFPTPALSRIASEVSQVSGVSLEEMQGRDRRKHIVAARQVCYWQARKSGHSLPEIGRFFNRDHTTVLSGIRKLEPILGGKD